MPSIKSIVYTPKGSPRKSEDAYVRVPINETRLIEKHGIEGDRKGGSPKRQLNVMSFETVKTLKADGLKTAPGQLGEQIVLEGVDVDNLPSGTLLQLGDAVIEILERRNGCDRFQHIQSKNPKTLAGRMGVMARVIKSGAIKVGDPVAQVSELQNA
jgi:MOSC domain-containing protein YiiM